MSLYDSIVRRPPLPRLRFGALKLLNVDFYADPDPAFHFYADQYPASKNKARPRGSGSSTLDTLHGLEQNGKAALIKDDISYFFFLFVATFVFPDPYPQTRLISLSEIYFILSLVSVFACVSVNGLCRLDVLCWPPRTRRGTMTPPDPSARTPPLHRPSSPGITARRQQTSCHKWTFV